MELNNEIFILVLQVMRRSIRHYLDRCREQRGDNEMNGKKGSVCGRLNY